MSESTTAIPDEALKALVVARYGRAYEIETSEIRRSAMRHEVRWALPVLLADRTELEAYRAEDLRRREWAAFCAESDVRCFCGTTYIERQTYSCGDPGSGPHEFDADELAEARRVEPSRYGPWGHDDRQDRSTPLPPKGASS